MLSKHRGPLPVLGVALAVFAVSGGVAHAQTTPRDIALKYAVDNAESLGVKPTDMTNLAVTSEYRSAHNLVTHVNIGQRRNGLTVFTGHVTVNVNKDSRVIFAGGNLVRGINDPVAGAELDAQQAIAAAADALKLDDPAGLRVVKAATGRAQATLFNGGGISEEPIPAQLGYQPTDDGLRMAWQVTINDEDGNLWEVAVDAVTGELLSKNNWTSHEKTPNPVNDGSSYRVFEFPKQDPNRSEERRVGKEGRARGAEGD